MERKEAPDLLRERHGRAHRPSSSTVIASFALAVKSAVGDQPQNVVEVAQAHDDGRSKDRAEGAFIHNADQGRGGDDCRVPAPHAAAVGQLHTLKPSIPHLPRSVLHRYLRRRNISVYRMWAGRQLQALSHRLLPHEYRGDADCQGKLCLFVGIAPASLP